MIYLYVELALLALLLVTAPYQLWCDYLGVMALKRQRDNGGLSGAAKFFGTYVLIRGYLLDFLCNTVHATIILREFPRELTVTKRLRRHIENNTAHAAKCLAFRTQLLDGFDPAGIHQ
ncbi:MAG: hypothetical protein V4451_15975 [Pseudomonadota bacterium]